MERRRERFSDTLVETGVQKILEVVRATPQQGNEIRLQALQGAKDFWENRLAQPDLIPDEILLGRRRLIQIASRIENLTINNPPPQNQ